MQRKISQQFSKVGCKFSPICFILFPVHRFRNGRFFCKAILLEVLSSLFECFFLAERLGGKKGHMIVLISV